MREKLAVVAAALAFAACSPTTAASDGGSSSGGTSGSGTGSGSSSGLTAGSSGTSSALSLGGVTPSHGPLGGGTKVQIAGNGFGSGIEITFGGQAAQSIALVSNTELQVVTPPGSAAGPTDVVASLGGQLASLDGGYSYDAPPAIGYCVLQFPKSLEAAPDSAAGPVYGRVYVAGVTSATGNQSQILGQAGWGMLGSVPDETWSWNPAAFNPSCSGCGNNYEYDATIDTGSAGDYALAFRFSTDQGNTWTNCDAAGDPTYTASNQGTLTVAAPPDGGTDAGVDAGPTISWCNLQFPATLDSAPGVTAGPVYGRVYVAGLTDSSGNPSLLEGQVGFGPTGSVPASDGGWSWATATYNPNCSNCGNNYEYDGTFTAPGPGSYALAFRFSLDGVRFVDCDAAGDMPYNPSNAGVLTVEAADAGTVTAVDAGPTLSIGWCDLQYPDALTGTTGSLAGPVYGRVYVAGLTDADGDAGAILAEVGFGSQGSDPGVPDAGWIWAMSAFNPTCSGCGNNYEYQGTLTAPSPGGYALAYRFSLDQGAHFTDCDALGDLPYDPVNEGTFTVSVPIVDAGPAEQDAGSPEDAGSVADAGEADAGGVADAGSSVDAGPADAGTSEDAGVEDAGTIADAGTSEDAGHPDAGSPEDAGVDAGVDAGPAPIPIQYCDLQFPSSLNVEPGANSGAVYARVYSTGVTDVAGNQAEILAQVGYGPAGSNPAVAGWSWAPASFNASCSGCGNNYEYAGAFTAPGLGIYAMAARFSGDQGATWTDCDAAGDATYSAANAGTLSVQWITVDWCDLQFPPTLSGTAGVDAGPIYGQVYQPGITDSAGNPGLLLAEVGVGPAGSDPTSPTAGWSWSPAEYNSSCLSCGNNYEYQGFVVPPASGSYAYVTRFSADDGGYWTTCGLGGPWVDGGVNDAGELTVP